MCLANTQWRSCHGGGGWQSKDPLSTPPFVPLPTFCFFVFSLVFLLPPSLSSPCLSCLFLLYYIVLTCMSVQTCTIWTAEILCIVGLPYNKNLYYGKKILKFTFRIDSEQTLRTWWKTLLYTRAFIDLSCERGTCLVSWIILVRGQTSNMHEPDKSRIYRTTYRNI